jgi:hypothetical protein
MRPLFPLLFLALALAPAARADDSPTRPGASAPGSSNR